MLYTVAETAERLKVSVATVYALCGSKQLAHTRVGVGRGTIRISDQAIEDYLQARTVGTSVSPPPRTKFLRLQ
jgi:excisionase family DNA binding protein